MILPLCFLHPSSLWGWSDTGTGWPERLKGFHHCGYLKCNWAGSSETCFRWFCFKHVGCSRFSPNLNLSVILQWHPCVFTGTHSWGASLRNIGKLSFTKAIWKVYSVVSRERTPLKGSLYNRLLLFIQAVRFFWQKDKIQTWSEEKLQ